MNRDDYPTSFNTIINQEVQFEDSGDERSLHNLSLEDLNNKVEIYKNLFLENVKFYKPTVLSVNIPIAV